MNLNNSIIYGIYPTSFYDSNGDGIGDLAGITQKLDYVKDLGADIIWLNPIYKSSFRDGGYDVTDHMGVDERFGTLDDFDALITRAHSLGLKVLLDLVIGHTSDEHEWFKQSAKAERNTYSDYYIWTDSAFTGGENTIKGVAERDGNYMVNFFAFQPALNFGYSEIRQSKDPWSGKYKMKYTDERLKPVREEVLKIMRFWLSRGADGFRVDMACDMIKGKRSVKALKWLYERLIGTVKKEYPDALFLAEWGVPEQSLQCCFDMDYLTHCSIGYNEMFRGDKNTNLLRSFENGHSYFSRDGLGTRKPLLDYTEYLGKTIKNEGYYCMPSGYHDIIRIAEGKGADGLKCVFAFLLTYKNLPIIYYGDEIGIKHNFGVSKDGGFIRTGSRTPMQWNNGKNRGFSAAEKLYLPVNEDEGISVEEQQKDPASVLNTVKELIRIRKSNPALQFDGSVKLCGSEEYPLTYVRENGNDKIFVGINPTARTYKLPERYKVIYGNNYEDGEKTVLLPEGFIIAEAAK